MIDIVDRLKTDPLRKVFGRILRLNDEAAAEIERLRELISDAANEQVEYLDRNNALEAAVGRLKEQIAAMERGYKSYRDTAEESFVLLQELRSLIRERLDGPPIDYGTTHVNVLAWDNDWLRRAKEVMER